MHGHSPSGPAGSGSTVDKFICHVASTIVAFEATLHFLGNILIEIDEDQARSEAYAMALHRRLNPSGLFIAMVSE